MDLDICRTGGHRSEDRFSQSSLPVGQISLSPSAPASFVLVIKNSDLLTPEAELQEWLMRLLLGWMQVLWLQTPMCSAGPMAAAPQHLVPTALKTSAAQAAPPPLMIPKCENPRTKPTLHVIAQRPLQLRQRVAPGTQLQQPQRHRNAQGGHDQVGAVLRLGECLVEADGEAGVELRHAVLKAAVPVAPLRQPKADDEGGRWQATHVLRGGSTETQKHRNSVLVRRDGRWKRQ